MTKQTICDKCLSEITDEHQNMGGMVQMLIEYDVETNVPSAAPPVMMHRIVNRDFHKGCLKNSRAIAGLEGF